MKKTIPATTPSDAANVLNEQGQLASPLISNDRVCIAKCNNTLYLLQTFVLLSILYTATFVGDKGDAWIRFRLAERRRTT